MSITDALFHINNAKRRLEEAEGLVRASAGYGSFPLLSYCKSELIEAMKHVPVSSLDFQTTRRKNNTLSGGPIPDIGR